MTDTGRFLLAAILFSLLIVLPATGYLKLRKQSNTRVVLSILAIWLVFNLINAPIHEGCHILGGRAIGLHVKDYQLIQHFWKGDFVHGYVSFENPSVPQLLVSCRAPYLADGVIVLFALLLFRWCSFSPLIGALILAMTFLRSVFDVFINYLADTVFSGKGDVAFLLSGYSPILVHLGAWLAVLAGAAGATMELLRAHRISAQ